MNRAAFSNLDQPPLLIIIQPAGQFDFTINAVQITFFGFTVIAILGVNPGVPNTYGHALQIPSLPLCIQSQRH